MAPPPPNLANAYPWMFVDTQGNEFHFEVDPVTGQEHYQDHNNLPVDPPPQGWVDTVQAHYQFLAAQQVPPPAAPTPPNQQQGVPPAQGPPGPAGPPGPGQPNPPGAPPQQPQQPQPQQQQPLPQQVPNPGVPPAAATPPQQPPNPQPTGGQPQTGPPPYQSPQPSAPFSQSGASNVTGTTTAGASAMAGMLSNMNVDDLMRLITGDKGTAPFFAQWLQTNAPSLGYTNVGPAAGPSTSTGGQGPSTQGTSAPTAGPSTNAPAAGSAPFQPQGQTPFYRMGASTYVPPSGGGAASSMFGGVSQGGPSAPSVPGLSAFRTHPSGMPGPQEGGGFQGAPLSVASAHSTAQHSSVSHSSSGIEGLPAQFTKSLRCSYFKGETDEDVILWASDLEEHLRALKVPVEMWAVAMGLFLKAGAGRWARSLPNTIRRDYCFFREALLAQYAGPMVFKARALLHGAKMDIRKETVMDFANKLQMLTAQSYPDTLPSGQQQMVLSALIQGVPLEIKRYGSAALACHTLREALGHLIAGERFYHMDREAQREKKANAPQVQSMIIEDVTDDHQALSLLEGRLAQTAQAANPGGPPTIPPQVATYLKGLLDVEHRDANTALNAIQQQQQGDTRAALLALPLTLAKPLVEALEDYLDQEWSTVIRHTDRLERVLQGIEVMRLDALRLAPPPRKPDPRTELTESQLTMVAHADAAILKLPEVLRRRFHEIAEVLADAHAGHGLPRSRSLMVEEARVEVQVMLCNLITKDPTPPLPKEGDRSFTYLRALPREIPDQEAITRSLPPPTYVPEMGEEDENDGWDGEDHPIETIVGLRPVDHQPTDSRKKDESLPVPEPEPETGNPHPILAPCPAGGGSDGGHKEGGMPEIVLDMQPCLPNLVPLRNCIRSWIMELPAAKREPYETQVEVGPEPTTPDGSAAEAHRLRTLLAQVERPLEEGILGRGTHPEPYMDDLLHRATVHTLRLPSSMNMTFVLEIQRVTRCEASPRVGTPRDNERLTAIITRIDEIYRACKVSAEEGEREFARIPLLPDLTFERLKPHAMTFVRLLPLAMRASRSQALEDCRSLEELDLVAEDIRRQRRALEEDGIGRLTSLAFRVPSYGLLANAPAKPLLTLQELVDRICMYKAQFPKHLRAKLDAEMARVVQPQVPAGEMTNVILQGLGRVHRIARDLYKVPTILTADAVERLNSPMDPEWGCATVTLSELMHRTQGAMLYLPLDQREPLQIALEACADKKRVLHLMSLVLKRTGFLLSEEDSFPSGSEDEDEGHGDSVSTSPLEPSPESESVSPAGPTSGSEGSVVSLELGQEALLAEPEPAEPEPPGETRSCWAGLFQWFYRIVIATAIVALLVVPWTLLGVEAASPTPKPCNEPPEAFTGREGPMYALVSSLAPMGMLANLVRTRTRPGPPDPNARVRKRTKRLSYTNKPSWVVEHEKEMANRREVERERKAAVQFTSFKRTAFARTIRKRSAQFSPRKLAREARAADEAKPFLSEILEEKRPQLGAVVNLDLGAAAIPQGLVMASSTKVFFYLVMDSAIPTWIPHTMRHPEHKRVCTQLSPEEVQACYRSMDPILSSEDCKQTREIQLDFVKEVVNFRAQYEGAFNSNYYRDLFGDLCTTGSAICTLPKPGTDPEFVHMTQDRRHKRWVVAATAGAGAFMSMIGIGMGWGNGDRIKALEENIEKFHNGMAAQDNSIKALKYGVVALEEKSQQQFEYVNQAIAHIYETIEDARCQDVARIQFDSYKMLK